MAGWDAIQSTDKSKETAVSLLLKEISTCPSLIPLKRLIYYRYSLHLVHVKPFVAPLC